VDGAGDGVDEIGIRLVAVSVGASAADEIAGDAEKSAIGGTVGEGGADGEGAGVGEVFPRMGSVLGFKCKVLLVG